MFVPRTRAAIRDSILSDWQARYAAIGVQLLVVPGSDAYLLADTLSVELEGLEAQALAVTKSYFPDTADTDSLNHHGTIDGIPRKGAIAAVPSFTVTGTNGLVTLGSQTINDPTGLTYQPVDGSGNPLPSFTITGGTATINARCTTTGTATNQNVGAVLAWSAAPTGVNPTVTVAGAATIGADAESDGAYAARIIAHRQSRPASGNRADWEDWCTGVTPNITEAYVYPLLQPSTTNTTTLGCVTVVVLGPPSTGSGLDVLSTDKRVPATPDVALVQQFVEGSGPTYTEQLRPVTMLAGNYSIEAPSQLATNVTIKITNAPAYPFPFVGSTATVAGSTTTVLQLASVAGMAPGQFVAVLVGTGFRRGGYQLGVIQSVGASSITLTAPLDTAPGTGVAVLPAPSNWPQIRDAVIRFFDQLGPGNVTNTTGPSARWPTEDQQGRATLYLSALSAAALSAPGVLSATVTAPGADVVPGSKQLVRLGNLTFTP